MEINTRKTQVIFELGGLNCKALVDKVSKLDTTDWDQKEDYELNYNKCKGALKQAKHLTLRFINRRTEPYQYLESKRWDMWKELLLPLMTEVISPYGYEKPIFPKVMLANLPSGSFIPPHIDGDSRGYVPHKIHLPLQTNEKAFFILEGKRYHFEVGKAYEVNNGLKHAVVNRGATDRIHLIFECLDYDIQLEETKIQMKDILNSSHF